MLLTLCACGKTSSTPSNSTNFEADVPISTEDSSIKIVKAGETVELDGLISVTLQGYNFESYEQYCAENPDTKYLNDTYHYDDLIKNNMGGMDIYIDIENISDSNIEKLVFGAKHSEYYGELPNFSLEYEAVQYPLSGYFYGIDGHSFVENKGEFILPTGTASVCLLNDISISMAEDVSNIYLTVTYKDITYKWQLYPELFAEFK